VTLADAALDFTENENVALELAARSAFEFVLWTIDYQTAAATWLLGCAFESPDARVVPNA